MKRQSEVNIDNSSTNKSKTVKRYLSEAKLKEIASIFLKNRKNCNILIDLLDELQTPKKIPVSYICTVENIFVEVLKRSDMAISSSENISEVESQYKAWLTSCYEDVWEKLMLCLEMGVPECRLQALNSLFNLLSMEAKFPLQRGKKKKNKTSFPVDRLRQILHSLSLSSELDKDVLKRVSEFLNYKDVESNVWLSLETMLRPTSKEQLTEKSVWNILLVLSHMPKLNQEADVSLCGLKNAVPQGRALSSAVDGVWKHLAPRNYSSKTHQLLLVVLVEQIMPRMDSSIFLTDYFMDALNRKECEISMLALQGIFNLILRHNIEYPNIYGKLYQLFTATSLKAKYKTRLFALADSFLRSTHLPLALVAAFVKKFSRLLLVATPPDCLIFLTFIANLLIRHPDLHFLIHKPEGKDVEEDPFKEKEKAWEKSEAMQSQLWEVKLMQHHHTKRVAKLASSITGDLPSTEYELEPLLDLTWNKIIKNNIKQLKKKTPQLTEEFRKKPQSTKTREAREKELDLVFSEFVNLFTIRESIIR